MKNKFIPYGKQDIDNEDIASVVEVLKSDFITQGPKVPLFEELVSETITFFPVQDRESAILRNKGKQHGFGKSAF